MKLVSNRFSILCAVLGLASFLTFSAQAQLTTISDSTEDIDSGISTGGGTLDIVKMEVGDTANDVVFKLTVNGNIATTDWGKFMIGIANGKGGATGGTKSGNGWGRPINLDAGTSGGMTHWIGTWVNGGNGANFFTYTESAWTETAATYSGNFPGFSVVAGAQSVITYTIPKASLGVVNGDTIRFDAYSSGGEDPDSAVDALANPSTSITSWGQTYTSSEANLASYTLADTLANATTQEITFSVNMSHQVVLGTFNPATDAVTVDWGTGFPEANYAYLTDGDADDVYTGSAIISAPEASSVPYRFTIEPNDINLPLLSENLNPTRTFSMPGSASAVGAAYYNNIEGYRDVTFSVNMSVQQILGNFNPATQTVEVRGPFNDWAGTALTAQGEGVYSGTVRVSGAAAAVPYKFFAGTYEEISEDNRSFNLAFNSDRAPTPAEVLDTVFYSNVNTVPDFRPVTFAVNMSRQVSLAAFNPATDFVEIRGTMNGFGGGTAWRLTDGDNDGIYAGTFNIEGTAATTMEYKFFNTASGAPNDGYESGSNRTVALGPVQTAQNVAAVFFSNDSGATRQVTFAVDMSIQQAMGKFDPVTGVVELRGIGDFEATDKVLTREGDSLIYKGTFTVVGDAGTSVTYKFFSTGVTESGFEIINLDDLEENRSITLGASGSPVVLDTTYFSNQSVVPPSGLSYTPSSASGTVDAAIGSLTPTVTGTVTAYSVSPALPAGLSISTSTGVISGTPTAVSASATYTVTATNGTGSTTATVTIEVSPAGSTFAGWSGGATLDAVNLAKYAIGGASNLSVEGVQSTSALDGTSLSITAIVRTDDTTLDVVGQAVTNLADYASSELVVQVEGDATGIDQTDVPAGCAKKKFSVARGDAGKKFLRLQATLNP